MKSSHGQDLARDMLINLKFKKTFMPANGDLHEAVNLISKAALIFEECGFTKEAKALESMLIKMKG